jgi:hypothetical protein
LYNIIKKERLKNIMKKKDFISTKDIDPKFKAVNAFIFAGSFSIGVMKAGFDLQKVLEISDSQPEENAFFFIKNVEDVPVILPKTWENDEYLDNLKNENIDLKGYVNFYRCDSYRVVAYYYKK